MERRSFSEYEQKVIKTIVESAKDRVDFLLVNAYNDIFYYTHVEYEDNELHIYYTEEEAAKLESVAPLEIQKKVIVRTLLLMYLEENRYIYLVEDKYVQNDTTDIKLANKKNTKFDLVKDLPDDIVAFLNRCHRRVILSEELIALVNDDFKTPEDKILEGIEGQITTLKTQIVQLENQRQATLKLVSAAEIQTKEAKSQTEQSIKQSKEALKQTKEVKSQTDEAQKQTAEALKQTDEAQKQTAEALKQTKEALTQTREAQKQTAESRKQTNINIIVLICSLLALGGAIATVCITNKQRKEANEYNQLSLEKQSMVDSVQTKIIQSIDGSIHVIKNNTDTIIFRQIETNCNVRRINNKLNKIN